MLLYLILCILFAVSCIIGVIYSAVDDLKKGRKTLKIIRTRKKSYSINDEDKALELLLKSKDKNADS